MSSDAADNPHGRDLRVALRAELKQAMRDRNRPEAAAYRIALAAIDNAEAVPMATFAEATAIETSLIGVGAAEAERRQLTDADVRDLVSAAAVELRDAADHIEPHDPADATVKRGQAAALDRVLDGP